MRGFELIIKVHQMPFQLVLPLLVRSLFVFETKELKFWQHPNEL